MQPAPPVSLRQELPPVLPSQAQLALGRVAKPAQAP
jgi:hypothetical protein